MDRSMRRFLLSCASLGMVLLVLTQSGSAMRRCRNVCTNPPCPGPAMVSYLCGEYCGVVGGTCVEGGQPEGCEWGQIRLDCDEET